MTCLVCWKTIPWHCRSYVTPLFWFSSEFIWILTIILCHALINVVDTWIPLPFACMCAAVLLPSRVFVHACVCRLPSCVCWHAVLHLLSYVRLCAAVLLPSCACVLAAMRLPFCVRVCAMLCLPLFARLRMRAVVALLCACAWRLLVHVCVLLSTHLLVCACTPLCTCPLVCMCVR